MWNFEISWMLTVTMNTIQIITVTLLCASGAVILAMILFCCCTKWLHLNAKVKDSHVSRKVVSDLESENEDPEDTTKEATVEKLTDYFEAKESIDNSRIIFKKSRKFPVVTDTTMYYNVIPMLPKKNSFKDPPIPPKKSSSLGCPLPPKRTSSLHQENETMGYVPMNGSFVAKTTLQKTIRISTKVESVTTDK